MLARSIKMDRQRLIRSSKGCLYLRRGMDFILGHGGRGSIMDMAITNMQKGFSMKVISLRERCMGMAAWFITVASNSLKLSKKENGVL